LRPMAGNCKPITIVVGPILKVISVQQRAKKAVRFFY
jgi:hypothetical protein